MINISTLFDPRYVFLIYAPIVFALNARVGHRLAIALTLTEWSNQILKWLLAGERPYWYAQERAHELANAQHHQVNESLRVFNDFAPQATNEHVPHLKQFPVTCELGAGSPSGHAMVTATVWYILLDALLRQELRVPFLRTDFVSEWLAASGKQLTRTFTWATYTMMLVLVSLSRVYLACHFPHQCVCGALLGLAIARLVAEREPLVRVGARASSHHFALATAFMFASAMATYGALRVAGVDPLWSVGKGLRWCVNKDFIHLDTTPFFSMTRYLGFCLGAGLCYKSAASTQRAAAVSELRPALAALVSVALGQALPLVPLPRASEPLFYFTSFLSYVAFAYAIAGLVPRLICANTQQQPQKSQ